MSNNEKNAFTLIEALMSLAIILVLAGLLLGGSKYLKVRAERQLTQSTIEIICTAMGQYYDEYKVFPFSNRDIDNNHMADSYTKLHLQSDTGGTVSPVGLTLEEKAGDSQWVCYASSAGMYYFLDKNKDSRQVIETISDQLITNKDALTGAALTITIGTQVRDLPRFIDAWGMSLRYEYLAGDSFPVVSSAGPDKIFNTTDDLKNQ